MDIDGHGAVVTGGASGFGEAVARVLADHGADVTILDTDGGTAAQVAAEIGGYSQNCDVSEEQAVAAGITSAMARFGQAPRIIVNCANLHVPVRVLGPEGKVSIPVFRQTVAVNLLGSYHALTYGAQGMMDLPPFDTGERGVIINILTGEPSGAGTDQIATLVTDGGLAAMTASAAQEFAPLGIRVEALALHPVEDMPEHKQAQGLSMPDAFARRIVQVIQSPFRSETIEA